MMWQQINNQWYAINPLRNAQGWSVVERRNAQRQLVGYWGNAPIDQTDPEVNQVFLKGITQANNEASGYRILTSMGGIAHLRDGNNQPHAARVHFHTRNGATTTNIPAYQADQEKLAVFGNVVTTAHTRDPNINGGDTGEGLTVHRLTYSVNDHTKYDVTFDRLQGNVPNTIGDDEDVFHYYYNQLTNQAAYGNPWEYDMGNNDYIRLYNAGTVPGNLNNCQGTENSGCPAAYLPVHKNITGIQSNGVWFTKARNTTPHVFAQTPADTAVVSEEALYPDGEHTLIFHVEDAAGRIDRKPGKAEDNAQVTTIVDNYRPYVKKLHMTSDTFPIYSSTWHWSRNGAQGTLALARDASGNQADRGKPLSITVTTSEPMQLTTDAQGKPQGSLNIKLFARDPNNPNRIKVYQDWYSPQHAEETTFSQPTPEKC